MIHSNPDSGAELVFARAVKGGRPGLTIEPPLVVRGPDGQYTPEMMKMFEP